RLLCGLLCGGLFSSFLSGLLGRFLSSSLLSWCLTSPLCSLLWLSFLVFRSDLGVTQALRFNAEHAHQSDAVEEVLRIGGNNPAGTGCGFLFNSVKGFWGGTSVRDFG